ncbi:MAG: ribosome maturation factor RimP [Acidimicrobiales bacterium]
MTRIDEVRAIAEPIVAAHGFELYDLDQHGPALRVTVTGVGGAEAPGIDDLGTITKELSRALDDADPISGRYTLEVSSPGLERRLRSPEHFRRAVGETVSVKVRVRGEPATRIRGVLVSADDQGIEVLADEADSGEAAESDEARRRLEFDVIDSARTVFDWEMVAARSDKGDTDGATRTRRSNR